MLLSSCHLNLGCFQFLYTFSYRELAVSMNYLYGSQKPSLLNMLVLSVMVLNTRVKKTEAQNLGLVSFCAVHAS